jgi:hypothetical protein
MVELLGPYAHHLTVQIFAGAKGCVEGSVGAEVTTKPYKAFATHTKSKKGNNTMKKKDLKHNVYTTKQ